MNSIVNLFPNKFTSKKGSGYEHNDGNNPVSSFSSSPQGSLSKQELQEKLLRIKQNREDSRRAHLKESSDSNEMITESPNEKAQMPYSSTGELKMANPPENAINKKSYIQLLETGNLMRNVNGDVLCKK